MVMLIPMVSSRKGLATSELEQPWIPKDTVAQPFVAPLDERMR
ncbi:MAG: hypothetical protein CM15mP2_4030 [Methanobacteriota archaeon]|nr:MAG: hypothetical protein CM15mP2_4030 [Euryarchaeota archaeon]